jgi:hypothetical protein
MNIHDFLIATADKEWAWLLNDWVPPLPASFHVWLVNRLGDAFVVVDDGTVFRLDVGMGVCHEAARSREDFAQRLATGDHAERWLRLGLVEGCRRAGMQLRPLECYGFRIPPTLGGKYEVSNMKPTKLAVHYSYQAYICKQTDIYWVPPG